MNESFNLVNKELDKQSNSSKEDEAGFVIISEKNEKKLKEAEMASLSTDHSTTNSTISKSESNYTDNTIKKSHSPNKFNETKSDAYNGKLNTLSHNRSKYKAVCFFL